VSEVAEFVRRCPMAFPYLTLIGSSFQIIEIEPKKEEKRKREKEKEKRTRTNFVSLNSMQIRRIHTLHARRELKARKITLHCPPRQQSDSSAKRMHSQFKSRGQNEKAITPSPTRLCSCTYCRRCTGCQK
jgi:hypothetical protein